MNQQQLSKATEKFEAIRDIPYTIPLAYGEIDHCCSGKNKMLKKFLELLSYEVRWRVCTFRWSSIDLPKAVAMVEHADDSTHAYLEFFVDGEWRVVDATWDKELRPAFPIEKWDGASATGVAVKSIEVYSPEKSEEIMSDDSREAIESDLSINGKFYESFNNWLVEIRKNI